jgi:putative phosphoesterase
MTTAFISDIHGNYEALKAVLASIDAMGITHIVCAGDVAGYYSEVNACCDTLRERGIPTVMGNHDWYLGGGGTCARSRSVNDCLEYQRRVITPANLAWLRGLPLQVEVNGVRVVHGGWSDPIDEYLKPSANYFSVLEGRFFLTGHTHLPCVHHYGDKIYCNPGSVGQPRDGDPRSAFAVFDGNDFTLHRVNYDFNKVFALMDAAGFNDYYYGGLATGARNLRRLAEPQEQKS